MALQVTIKGTDKVLKNLQREVAKVIGNSKKGLIQVGLLIKAGSMRKTPIDLGNLRASHYVSWDTGQDSSAAFASSGDSLSDRKLVSGHSLMLAESKGQAGRLGVQVGVSAFYAVYVHENSRGYSFKVGQAKFFESAIEEVTPQALTIIKQKAKI